MYYFWSTLFAAIKRTELFGATGKENLSRELRIHWWTSKSTARRQKLAYDIRWVRCLYVKPQVQLIMIKVLIVSDSMQVYTWEVFSLHKVLEVPGVEVTGLVITDKIRQPQNRFLRMLTSYEKSKYRPKPDPFQQMDLAEEFGDFRVFQKEEIE